MHAYTLKLKLKQKTESVFFTLSSKWGILTQVVYNQMEINTVQPNINLIVQFKRNLTYIAIQKKIRAENFRMRYP